MRFDHVGIAVESIEAALPFYRDAARLVVAHREEVASQNVRVAFLKDPDENAAPVELLEPTSEEGALSKFLKSRGPGLHHVAFHARDIAGEMRRLAQAGRAPIDAAVRPGARGHQVCFLHPRHAGGVLVELVG